METGIKVAIGWDLDIHRCRWMFFGQEQGSEVEDRE